MRTHRAILKMISFRFLVFTFLIINVVQSLNKLNCKCRLGLNKKIVGGQFAPNNYVPWQAALFYAGTFICGAFILNERNVLTASHCSNSKLRKLNVSSLVVVVGVTSLKGIDLKYIYGVEKSINHPLFNSSALQKGHDIAILKLNRTIQFEATRIEPACLKYKFSTSNETIQEDILVSGFGGTSHVFAKNGLRTSLTPSTQLKYTFFTEYFTIYSKQLINAHGIKKNESTCNGDSGSPAMITQKGKTYVVGLNSFGLIKTENSMEIRCMGNSGFCRLAFESQFIEKHVNKKDFCLF